MKFRLIIDPEKEEEITATVRHPSSLTEQIETLVMQYSGADRIPGYRDEEVKMLSIPEIECITIIDGKTWAIDSQGTHYRLKLRLYELEELLPSSFIRINKSTLANENRLDRFAVCFSGAVDVIFKCGYREYVSRRCFSEIKKRYGL